MYARHANITVSTRQMYPLTIVVHVIYFFQGLKGKVAVTHSDILNRRTELILVSYKDGALMGTGTTAVVAKRMNRKFIGSKISEAYYKSSLERLADVI